MDNQFQRMRLIVDGAIFLYEGQGLEISSLLMAQNRKDLMDILDTIIAALYWLKDELDSHDIKTV